MTLFKEEPSGPVLQGGRCNGCGYIFFPMQVYGCEQCGSLDLVEATLGGSGRLASSALVHVHPDPELKAPFMIGSIELDSGVTVRAIVDVEADACLEIGDRMEAITVAKPRRAVGDVDLRFVPIGKTSA